MCNLFGFLHKLTLLSPQEIITAASHLTDAYHDHLELSLSEELIQFSEFVKLKRECAEKSDGSCDSTTSIELKMYKMVMQTGVQEIFPNVEIALRIYLLC